MTTRISRRDFARTAAALGVALATPRIVSPRRTLLADARIDILLDEPIGHLDAKLRHRMRGELKEMSADMNATIVLVTTASREALALGVDIGGNLTPIGASANVVAYAYTEHHYENIGWKRWLAAAAPATLLVMLVATVLVMWKSAIGWH